MSDWTPIGNRDQVAPEWPLAATVGTLAIGVYEVDGALHAIEDICPHAQARLSEGFIEGCEVECPLHNAVFDVTSGKHLRGEPCRDVKTFAVRVVDGRVEVQAPG
ncbi:MAG: hypothetical protein AD742_20685 [Methylibium sp. NZG]|nr:MAG: hypothetical protein AD742_20685 [Methylibium sp. NZG]